MAVKSKGMRGRVFEENRGSFLVTGTQARRFWPNAFGCRLRHISVGTVNELVV